MLYKLESWRGLAAILVVLYHSTFNFGETKIVFLQQSNLFVDLFFILSGFVMALAYERKIKSGMRFTTFCLLRFGRLYPLHLFMLVTWLIYLIVKHSLHMYLGIGSPQFYNGGDYDVWSFVTHLFLINGMWTNSEFVWNAPSWSISVEMFTYLFFFLFVRYTVLSDKILPSFCVSVFLYCVIFIISENSLALTLNGGFIRCLAGFYLGISVLKFKNKIAFSQLPCQSFLEIISVAGLILSLSLFGGIYGEFISVVLMAIIIFIFSFEYSGYIGRILELNHVKSIGRWSFSIYMVHSLIISIHKVLLETVWGVTPEDTAGPLSLVVNFSIVIFTIIISSFTYRYIEVYFRTKTKRLAGKI